MIGDHDLSVGSPNDIQPDGAPTTTVELRKISEHLLRLDDHSPEGKTIKWSADEIDRLRAGIVDYPTGNYPNPNDTRPEPCKHGALWYHGCMQCDEEHFRGLLRNSMFRREK